MEPSRGRIPQLDGLRAFAILPVLLTHSWRDFKGLPFAAIGPAGWIGVDLFLVLSGFLITGILLDSRGSEHYFRNFYARRGLRIWPLYFTILAYVFLVLPHIPALAQDGAALHGFKPIYYVLYLQNFKYGTGGPFPLAVTWSLAVEEHFYLVWPVLVAWTRKETLQRLLILFIAATAIGRYFLLPWFGNSTASFLRFDEMAWGALLACWLRSPSYPVRRLRGWACAGAWLVPLVVWCILRQPAWSWLRSHGVVYTLLGAGFFSWVALAVTAERGSWLVAVLQNRFLRYTGVISYGLYLFHPIVMPNHALHVFLDQLRPGLTRDAAEFLVEFAAVYMVAGLSWRFFESPILKLKSRFEWRPRAEAITA
ncbi:MAG: acyltransferase [Acidobacteria bacterium]|nr:acyltransferase [Acidobacteriota bacterium]